MDLGMDDSYDTYYFLDVWDNTHMRYCSGASHFYDEIERRFLRLSGHPETVTRIRKWKAKTNTVIRKSGGYYLHKQRSAHEIHYL